MQHLVSQGYTGLTVRGLVFVGWGPRARKTMQTQASLRGGVPTAFCSTAISIVFCAAVDHVQILDLDAEALMQQVSVSERCGDHEIVRPLLLLWSPYSKHAMRLPQSSPAACSPPARSASQRQRLQQARQVDVLVVAADVCNKAAVERAVKEHVSRCACAFAAVLLQSSISRPSPKQDVTMLRIAQAQQAGSQAPSSTQPLLPSSALPPVSPPVCRFGGLDVALLCAGIGERGDFLDAARTTEQLEKTLDVDLTAVIAGTRLVAQAMIDGGRGGRIVSIASAAGARLGRG